MPDTRELTTSSLFIPSTIRALFASTQQRVATKAGLEASAAGSGRLPRYRYDAVKLLPDTLHRCSHIEIILQVQPELRRSPQRLAEPQRAIGGDRGRLDGDPFDPRARNAASLRQCAGRKSERKQKLFLQDLAGMHRWTFLGHG